MIYTAYLDEVLDPPSLQETAKRAALALGPAWEAGQIDCMLCTGVSGVSFASAVSLLTGIPMLVCRKPGEQSHSFADLEGYYPPGGGPRGASPYPWAFLPDRGMGGKARPREARVLFVDDMVCTGGTVARVAEAMKVKNYPGKLVGFYLYRCGTPDSGAAALNGLTNFRFLEQRPDPSAAPWAHGRGPL